MKHPIDISKHYKILRAEVIKRTLEQFKHASEVDHIPRPESEGNLSTFEQHPISDELLQMIWKEGWVSLLHHIHPHPQRVSPELHKLTKSFHMKSLHFSMEMQQLLQGAQKIHLKWTPWKGPSLSQHIHHNAHIRQYNDLDFLIDIDDLDRGIDYLRNSGYVPNGPHLAYCRRLPLEPRSSLEFHHPQKNIALDLTFRLSPIGSTEQVSTYLQAPQSAKPELGYLQINKVQYFHCLCVHGSKHAWERESWIMDIIFLWEKDSIHWKDLLLEAKKYGQKKHLAFALIEMKKLYPNLSISAEQLLWANKHWPHHIRPVLNNSKDEIRLCFQLQSSLFNKDSLRYLITPSIQDWNSSKAQTLWNPKLWFARLQKLWSHR